LVRTTTGAGGDWVRVSAVGSDGCVSALHFGFSSQLMGAVVLAQPVMAAAATSVNTSLGDMAAGEIHRAYCNLRAPEA
jgi:hypothetical protein